MRSFFDFDFNPRVSIRSSAQQAKLQVYMVRNLARAIVGTEAADDQILKVIHAARPNLVSSFAKMETLPATQLASILDYLSEEFLKEGHTPAEFDQIYRTGKAQTDPQPFRRAYWSTGTGL